MEIEYHNLELQQSLRQIESNIVERRFKVLNPVSVCVQILDALKHLQGDLSDGKTLVHISDRIRKIHDFYGWKSKGSVATLGLCAGTVYRSKNYLTIDPFKRSGSKQDRLSDYGVHIEHSIPVAILRKIIKHKYNATTRPEDLFHLIMQYSLCTAFSRADEKNNIKKGAGSHHPAFDNDNLPALEALSPFARYKPETEIYSVLDGSKVDLSATIVTLNAYMNKQKIYDWQFLSNYYA